jgi:hypothetical protein
MVTRLARLDCRGLLTFPADRDFRVQVNGPIAVYGECWEGCTNRLSESFTKREREYAVARDLVSGTPICVVIVSTWKDWA